MMDYVIVMSLEPLFLSRSADGGVHGRSGAIAWHFRRLIGFEADRNMAGRIDGKLQPFDCFVDPVIPICSIGFRFRPTSRSLGETGLLAIHGFTLEREGLAISPTR
jgi:hypothetical protein